MTLNAAEKAYIAKLEKAKEHAENLTNTIMDYRTKMDKCIDENRVAQGVAYQQRFQQAAQKSIIDKMTYDLDEKNNLLAAKASTIEKMQAKLDKLESQNEKYLRTLTKIKLRKQGLPIPPALKESDQLDAISQHLQKNTTITVEESEEDEEIHRILKGRQGEVDY